MTRENPRETAVEVLQRRAAGAYTEDLLESAWVHAQLTPLDRHLCQELVYGVARWQAALDWLISRKTQGKQQKPVLQNLLRIGLYQIFWLDRVPPHAAVNESVEIARKRGFGPQSGFINAVLRGYLRERDLTLQLLAALQKDQPHIGYSHPEWLVRRWERRWGAEDAASLMRWNNAPPPSCARVNTLKTNAGDLLKQWRDEGVDYDFVLRPWLEANLAFELKSHPPLHKLASFQEGKFYVQDPSTLLAVALLDPQPGEAVLDMCAAPGGKLTCIAQRMRNEGLLVAHDLSTERLQFLGENVRRLGVTMARATTSMPPGSRAFDRVMVDAPCSNTGVVRRRVDARWRASEKEIVRLRGVQLGLLDAAACRLKTGGILVYSTCSLEPEENLEVVERFLNRHSGFKLLSFHELLPFRDKTDGAFVAVMRGEQPGHAPPQ